MKTKKKAALVTGAGKGIGKEIALSLAKAGYFVILCGRNATNLSNTGSEIEALGFECYIVQADVSDSQQVEKLFKEISDVCETLDIVVNNAGLGYFKPTGSYTEMEYDRMFDTNMKGSFLVSQMALPLMKKQASGHIIMITSDVAKRVFAGGALYCASKHAQDAFASALRKEARPFGIKVTAIMPGLTDTCFGDTQQGAPEKKGWLKPSDIAQTVMFAISMPAHVLIDEILVHPMEQEIA